MECRGGLVSKSCLTLVIPWTVAHQAPKKNETAPFSATWMELETVILSEVSQIEGKYHMTPLISGIKKEMIQMNALIINI